jgi:hypothetical protein
LKAVATCASSSRHRDSSLTDRDPLDAIHQVGDRPEDEALEGHPDGEAEEQNQHATSQRDLVILAEQGRLQAARDEGDLEHPVFGAGRRSDREEDAVQPGVAALVHEDGQLPRIPDSPMMIERHARIGGEEVRVDSRLKAPVQQPDANDLGLPDDQVIDEPPDVGERPGPERVLHREPDGRARDADAQVELGPSLCSLLSHQDVGEHDDDQDHRHEQQ